MPKINDINKYPSSQVTDNSIVLGSKQPNGETVNYEINDIAQYISEYIEGGGTTPINQNNKIIVRNVFASGNGVWGKINNSEQFEILEDEIFIFVLTEIIDSLADPDAPVRLKSYYYLFRAGKGTYGVGGTQVNNPDFFLIRETDGYTFNVQDPIVNFIVALDVEDPASAVNNSSEFYNIETGTDFYFVIVNDKGNEQMLYRFVGDAGEYGSGTDVAVPTDFLLVEDLGGGGSMTSTPKTSDFENNGEFGRVNERYITNLDLNDLTLSDITGNGNVTEDSIISEDSFEIINDNSDVLGIFYNESGTSSVLELYDTSGNSSTLKPDELEFIKGANSYKLSLNGDTLPSTNLVYRLPLTSGRLMTINDSTPNNIALETAYAEWGLGVGDTQENFNDAVYSEVEGRVEKSGDTMTGNLLISNGFVSNKPSSDVRTIFSPKALNFNNNNTGALVISHPYVNANRIQMEVSVSKVVPLADNRKEKYFISFGMTNSSTINSLDLEAICLSNNEDVKSVKVGFKTGGIFVIVIDDDLISTPLSQRRITIDNINIIGSNLDNSAWLNDWDISLAPNFTGYTLTEAPTQMFSAAMSSVPAHNSLSGIQGGTTDEYYHLTEDQYINYGKRVVLDLDPFTLPDSSVHPAQESFAPVTILTGASGYTTTFINWEIVWTDSSIRYKISSIGDYNIQLSESSGTFQISGQTRSAADYVVTAPMNPKLILYY